MEENENVEVNETVENNVVSDKLGWLKNKKGIIIAVVIALVAICVIFNVFFNTKGKAKSLIKDFCKSLEKGKYEKALKMIDPVGMYAFAELDKDEYEDFWNEYKEFKKSDEWEDAKEEWDELLEQAKDAEEDFDKDEAMKIKVKKFKDVKKVGKNLYKVKAKIETEVDDEEDSTTTTFYVMKDGLKCKLVGGEAVSSIMMMIAFSSL